MVWSPDCIGVVRLADLLATGVMLRTTMVVMTGGERFDAGYRLRSTTSRKSVSETAETGGKVPTRILGDIENDVIEYARS